MTNRSPYLRHDHRGSAGFDAHTANVIAGARSVIRTWVLARTSEARGSAAAHAARGRRSLSQPGDRRAMGWLQPQLTYWPEPLSESTYAIAMRIKPATRSRPLRWWREPIHRGSHDRWDTWRRKCSSACTRSGSMALIDHENVTSAAQIWATNRPQDLANLWKRRKNQLVTWRRRRDSNPGYRFWPVCSL